MEDTNAQIDIKPVIDPSKSIISKEAAEQVLQKQRIPFPFFRLLSRSRVKMRIISVFVNLLLIAFSIMMILNDCGDSSARLDAMDMRNHQSRSLFIRQCWHAGVLQLIFNLSSLTFVGVHLELVFGPIRMGSIYIFSAISGSVVAALSLQNRPSVASSSALFGLLGAAISMLIQNRKVYSKKFATLTAFLIILMLNFMILGKMPCVDNFSSIGGFISGFLAGFMLLVKPKLNLDIAVLRRFLIAIFILIIAVVLEGLQDISYCPWCYCFLLKLLGLSTETLVVCDL